jgi:alpha-L-rhamnosidase
LHSFGRQSAAAGTPSVRSVRLEHPSPFDARWHGRWIWHERPRIGTRTATRPEVIDPSDEMALFRRIIDVDAVPSEAPCRLWSDGRHILYVNGVEVSRGPVRAEPRSAHYDVVDLAPHLVKGSNVIAIHARRFADATSWWTPVAPSYTLGAGSVLLEALIGDTWVGTDRSWRCLRGDAWSAVPVPGDVACLPLESFDARLHPAEWIDVAFDDSSWRRAVEITPMHTGAHGDPQVINLPFGMLRPPVRQTMPSGGRHRATLVATRRLDPTPPRDDDGVGPVDPVRQVLDDEANVFTVAATTSAATTDGPATLLSFDLGRVAAGVVHLEIDSAEPGTVVDLAVAEHVDDAGNLVTLGQHAGLRYICAGGTERFTSFDVIGTRHLHVSVREPAQHVGTPRDIAVSLSIEDRLRPRPPGASFACSDPTLERIHQIGLRTVDLCALDAYVDCPTREQRAWTGDSVVHQMVDLTNNPDWSMAIWHPQLAAAPRPDGMLPMAAASDFARDDASIVPDWALHWVRSVHNLYRYTGDRDLIGDLLPVVERCLRWFEAYLTPQGLLRDVPGWVLLDWSSVYGRDCSSTLNGLWARALEDFAEMAHWIGNDASATWAMGRYDETRDAFDVFWDESRSIYVDHLLDGVPQRPAAQHGGAAALAAGLVPTDRISRVVARLTDRSRLIRHSFVMDPVRVGGDSSGFIHLVTGYPDPVWDVEEQIVEAQPFFRYVVHDGLARAGRADLIADLCRDWTVFVDAGLESWPECWTSGTSCHGWSSTPSRDLIVHTLGIQPAAPGYGSVSVRPALGGLEWARATVPTPHGFITVEAHADGRVEIESPVPVVQ